MTFKASNTFVFSFVTSTLSGRPVNANFNVVSMVLGVSGKLMVGDLVGLGVVSPFGPFVLQIVENGLCTPQHISLVL